jgi:hypothetical protein
MSSLFFTPFSLVFGFYLYQSLKTTTTAQATEDNLLQKKHKQMVMFTWFGGIGILIGVALLIFSFGFLLKLVNSGVLDNTKVPEESTTSSSSLKFSL